MLSSSLLVTAALSLASTAHAQSIAKTCPQDGLCYSLNIPDATAKSGTGPIFFQVSAPTSLQWAALGQGSKMAGAHIFVVYASSNGNVTISPRLGTGHVQPKHDTATQVTLLAGSGIDGNTMTANVRCDNCQQWSGGSMDFTTTSGNFICAWKQGSPLNSDDPAENISYHDGHDNFGWDFTKAQGGDSQNPFISTGSTGTGSGSATTTTMSPGSNPSSSSGSSTSEPNSATFSNSGAPFGGDSDRGNRIILAHAVLAALAFIALFPIGSLLIRVTSLSLWIHAGFQIFAFAIFTVAFGLGVYTAIQTDQVSHAHPIIGIVLFVVLLFQPLSGNLHHKMFVKYGRRTASSYEHVWVGRVAIFLGIVNGGLGIQLAGDVSQGGKIAYAVCGAFMAVLYLAGIVYGELKRRKTLRSGMDQSQMGQSRALGSEEGDGRVELTEHVATKVEK